MTTSTIAVQPIIEARQLEKYYPQPDGSRIQVIAPTDIAIYHCFSSATFLQCVVAWSFR